MYASNRSGILCKQHPTQQYSNYCTSLNCIRPLCPDCVEIHTKLHDKQEIESWKHCLTKQKQVVNGSLMTLRKIQEEQKRYMPGKTLEQVVDDNLKVLYSVKDKVHKMVEEVFSGYEQHLVSLIKKNYKADVPDVSKLKMAIQQLVKLNDKLNSSGKTILQGLRLSLQLDHQNLLKFFQQLNYKQRKPVNQTYLLQNHELYSRLKTLLESSISFTKPKQQSSSSKYQSPSYKHQQSSQGNLFEPLKITVGNYFVEKSAFRFLHFFIPSSNELKVLPVEEAQRGSFNWKSILFTGKKELPCYFKSIITPQGVIYLTGGSENESRSNEILKLNYQKKTLDLVCRMKYQRSSHSICYANGLVYLIGGFSNDENDVTRTCEVFDPVNNTCRQISPLNAPSANSCAVSFNNEFIFKIGGVENKTQGNNLIEMYSIKKNKWIVVDVQADKSIPMMELLSFSAAVQINQGELLVFGGYDNSEYEKPERLCYTLQVNTSKGSVRVKNYNTTPLPYAQGFWNNNPTVWKGRVYALQNINDPQDQLTAIADQKRVIIFDGDRWHS